MTELAQEVNLLHKLLLIEAQMEDSAGHSTLSDMLRDLARTQPYLDRTDLH